MNFPYRLSAGLLLACVCAAAPVFAAPPQEKVLHYFVGPPSDGSIPSATLIADKTGNLYGTTQQGGTGGCIEAGATLGCGTLFEMSPPSTSGDSWTETVLYSFQGASDGASPVAGLVMDAEGNLYGTTASATGTVFELSPPATSGSSWTLTTLHAFEGSDGAAPSGSLMFDKSGNLYGTTQGGGYYGGTYCLDGGCGTVFELSPPVTSGGAWTEKVLYAFAADLDGAYPRAGLVMDEAGNLYGTTYAGGVNKTHPCTSTFDGCGTVFELHPSAGTWTEHILHSFTWTDGDRPVDTLTFYKGALYGTTSEGQDYGSVFQLAVSAGKWTLTSLFTFNENDGSFPMSEVSIDSSGNLFGTTNGGPADGSYGNVFELSPPTTSGGAWGQTILHSFISSANGGPIGGTLTAVPTFGTCTAGPSCPYPTGYINNIAAPHAAAVVVHARSPNAFARASTASAHAASPHTRTQPWPRSAACFGANRRGHRGTKGGARPAGDPNTRAKRRLLTPVAARSRVLDEGVRNSGHGHAASRHHACGG